MKILHITGTFQAGGAEKIVLGLAEAASQKGHQVEILTLLPGNDFEEKLENLGIRLQSLNFLGRFNPLKFRTVSRLRKDLLKKILEINPDIIHTHLFLPKTLLFNAGKKLTCPVIHTQHDNCIWWFKKDIKSRIQTWIDKKFHQNIPLYTVAISDSVKHDLETKLNLPSVRCPRIYNFIDFPDTPPVIPNEQPEIFRIGLLTRLEMEKKGIDIALKVFDGVKKQIANTELVIIGKGKDEMKIKEMVKEMGLEESVVFRGHRQDIYHELRLVHAILMPSRWEGFGLVAAEAAAAARPVIASRVGGLPEVVNNEITGLLCDSEDLACFIHKMQRLISDFDLYKKMARVAAEMASHRFSVDQSYQEYAVLYSELLNSKQEVERVS